MPSIFSRFKKLLTTSRREDFLQKLPKHSVGAELGVFNGDFSKQIIDIVNPKQLHLIDVWWEAYGEYYPDWGRSTNFGKLKTKDAYNNTLKNIAKSKDACVIHVGNSIEVIETLPNNYFDWVYIDSSHSYEQTKGELQSVEAKMKPTGIITGHD